MGAATSAKPNGSSNGSYNGTDPDRLAAVLLAEGVPLVRVPADLERALLVSGAVVTTGFETSRLTNLNVSMSTFTLSARMKCSRLDVPIARVADVPLEFHGKSDEC